MAIQLKTPDNYGYQIAGYFDVDPDLIDKCKSAGVALDQATPGVFSVKYNGKMVKTITIKGQAISLAKQGTIGPASKEGVKIQFQTALQQALSLAGSASPSVSNEPKTIGQVLKEKLAQTQPDSTKPTGATALATPTKTGEGPQIFFGAVVHGSVPVPLLNATMPYQPVKGSSSTYKCFAVLDGAAIGVNRKGNTLSVRAEGANLGKYAPILNDLDLDNNGHYYSAHFQCPNQDLMKKTLACVVGQLGLGNIKLMADIEKFVEAL